MFFFPKCRGGFGRGQGHTGDNGTITGKACPEGLYGIFCEVDLQIHFSLFCTCFKG